MVSRQELHIQVWTPIHQTLPQTRWFRMATKRKRRSLDRRLHHLHPCLLAREYRLCPASRMAHLHHHLRRRFRRQDSPVPAHHSCQALLPALHRRRHRRLRLECPVLAVRAQHSDLLHLLGPHRCLVLSMATSSLVLSRLAYPRSAVHSFGPRRSSRPSIGTRWTLPKSPSGQAKRI